MPSKKFVFVLALLLITGTFTAHAQSSTQQSSLTITPGSIYPRYSPQNFSIGPFFVDSGSTSTVYTVFEPGITEETLTPDQQTSSLLPGQFVVEDALGSAFEAQIHFSNLIDTENDKIIPFEAFSMVSLADDPIGIDPFNNNTPPANTVGVSAPISCLGWNNNVQTNCTAQFNSNVFIPDSTLHATDPVLPTDSTETIIYVDPAKPYSENAIIEFSDGEKALITTKAVDNSYIIVRRGILGTTPAPHPAGSGITCSGHSAKPVTIISGTANPSRIGSYSVAFALRLVVEPYFEPGTYNGLITFDVTSP